MNRQQPEIFYMSRPWTVLGAVGSEVVEVYLIADLSACFEFLKHPVVYWDLRVCYCLACVQVCVILSINR